MGMWYPRSRIRGWCFQWLKSVEDDDVRFKRARRHCCHSFLPLPRQCRHNERRRRMDRVVASQAHKAGRTAIDAHGTDLFRLK